MVNDMMDTWKKAQEWELAWHDNCINSLNEELKQIVYAEKMGLLKVPTPKTPYNFDLEGASVLDIGGGAYSLLLKCTNYPMYDDNPRGKIPTRHCVVTDPLMDKYPAWVHFRYEEAGIRYSNISGENVALHKLEPLFDEVWIYNVLQHTIDPAKIAENALKVGRIVRVFEWVNTMQNVGHPHILNELTLNKWFDGEGKVEQINRNGAVGMAYYGVFKGINE